MNKRMIFDIPPEIQMAIKLRSVKDGCTTGEVVSRCVHEMFPEEVKEAQESLANLKGGDVTWTE